MELTFQWFWLVKLALLLIVVGSLYMALVKYKLKSTLWNAIAIIAVVFSYMMPVKMEPTTKNINIQMDRNIATTKVELPPKQVDNSFKQSGKLSGISKEDIK